MRRKTLLDWKKYLVNAEATFIFPLDMKETEVFWKKTLRSLDEGGKADMLSSVKFTGQLPNKYEMDIIPSKDEYEPLIIKGVITCNHNEYEVLEPSDVSSGFQQCFFGDDEDKLIAYLNAPK